jgi:hypothetical protein
VTLPAEPTLLEPGHTDSIQEEAELPENRRTLGRAFAAVVALAAISPLFEADPNGCARGTRPIHSARRSAPPVVPEPLQTH